MEINNAKAIIEGLLFLWGEPLSSDDIASILEIKPPEAKAILDDMINDFDSQNRGLTIIKTDNFYQLSTREEHFDYFSKLVKSRKPSKLTGSSMETLSIIAYKQPVTRVEIDNIRGTKSTSSIDTLLSRGLIEECGRLEQIGRPILYRTTIKFLDYFGLTSLKELPERDQIEKLLEAEENKESIEN